MLVFSAAPPTASAQLQKEDFTFRGAATGSLPIDPSQLSDPYSFGRGLNVGLGVFITPEFDVQAGLEYTKYNADLPTELEDGPLRPDLPIESAGALSAGGDLTRLSLGLGLKWTFSRSESFRPYLRVMGHLSQLTRQRYIPESPTGPVGESTPVGETSPLLQSRDQTATGFSVGLGFVFPVSYTTAFFVEPSFASHYAELETIQAVDIRFGVLLGRF